MKNFPEICPLIPEVFADEAQMLVILPKLFRCGLLTRTEVSAIETVPMEKMCRVKVMLELCKMKDKFIAPLLKVLELCQTPYSAHILRIAVGFVTHSFPDIQSLLESGKYSKV